MTMKSIIFVCLVCVVGVISFSVGVKATETVSSNATETSPSLKAESNLDAKHKAGIVTLEFTAGNNETLVAHIYQRIPETVAKILNENGAAAETNKTETITDNPVRRRRRRSTDAERTSERYSKDGIGLVTVDPAIKGDTLRIPLFAEDRDGQVLDAAQLSDKLNENKKEISDEVGAPLTAVYAGMPGANERSLAKRATIWELHWKMFLAILILIAIAIFLLIICCLCFYCCRRRKSLRKSGGKYEQPKKPLPDEQMVELTPIVPLQCAPQQQQQRPNSVEEQPSADDENGWIVPIDQLSPEELDQPADVQISKL